MTMLIAILASAIVLAPLWWGIDALGRRLGVPEVLPARHGSPSRPGRHQARPSSSRRSPRFR
jgi:hypothetical protein